jgi:hypothetical protein
MGSRATVKVRRRLRVIQLLAASLTMLLATVPALAAQSPDEISEDPTPVGRDMPGPAAPGESPVESPTGPPGGVPGICEHAPGEFLVGYASEKALQAAPPENVVETFTGILAQHLAFEEIKNIPDPVERVAAEEAKRQELLTRPGIAYVEYNCIAGIASTAEANRAGGPADLLPAPASCGDCGRYVADRAKKTIAEGSGGAEGRDAFKAALEAVRSAGTDDDDLSSDSESEPDEGSVTDGYSAAEDASEDATAGSEGSANRGAEKKAADTGTDTGADAEEKAATGRSSSNDTEAEGNEDASIESLAKPISEKNAVAASRLHESDGSGGGVLNLGAGALLLVAGIFVARRIF